MPAFRERIYVCPGEDGRPVHVVDFPLWWDRREFFAQYRERRIDTGNPFYVDYGLLLTASEAKVWDKRCKEQYEGQHPSPPFHMVEAMREFDSALANARWVVIESYEWESGMD